MKTDYTDDELATLPQTFQVFDVPDFKFDDHLWIQQGYEIIDSCPNCPRQGIPIQTGRMLIKDKGGYRLVDEVTRK